MKKIRIISYKVGKVPEIIEIEDSLKALQDFVEGYIQAVPLEDNLCLICNEEGLLKNLSYQREYSIHGNFFIALTEGDEIVSMNKDIAQYVLDNIQKLLRVVNRQKQ